MMNAYETVLTRRRKLSLLRVPFLACFIFTDIVGMQPVSLPWWHMTSWRKTCLHHSEKKQLITNVNWLL